MPAIQAKYSQHFQLICYRLILQSHKMPKNQLGYNKPPEPKFIQEMKAKLGYREAQETLQDKMVGDAGAFDDREGD